MKPPVHNYDLTPFKGARVAQMIRDCIRVADRLASEGRVPDSEVIHRLIKSRLFAYLSNARANQDFREALSRLRVAEAECAALRAELEKLRNPPVRLCARCGAPENDHPYRHPFEAVAQGGGDE